MRLLVTGASGLVGSNLAAAAVQQSWKVLGTWGETPVRIPGARTARLDMTDRHACLGLAEHYEPDVIVHAAASVALGALEREPGLAQLNRLGTEHTLAAARAVRAHYVLVSSDWVFSGHRPPGQCWDEHDPTDPVNAYGRSKLACERAVQDHNGSWLITRPANVYGVNLSIPATRRGVVDLGGARNGADRRVGGGASEAHVRHVWERSSLALRWVTHLRAGLPLPAPADVHQSPTYAWDYAQRVCELIAQECEGICNTAGPDALGRRDYLRLLARAFDCHPELVREGSSAELLKTCGEDPGLRLPSNTVLCDEQATFVLGRPAVDPLAGHRLMREQLRRVLGGATCASAAPARAAALIPAIKETGR
jgi:dTDP-4-dehydrorhamnose reductase